MSGRGGAGVPNDTTWGEALRLLRELTDEMPKYEDVSGSMHCAYCSRIQRMSGAPDHTPDCPWLRATQFLQLVEDG